jgi:hypothetical protein
MIRISGVVAMLLLASLSAFAQNDSVPTREASHYFAIQANQLFRQLVNLGGGSTSPINNPYLITYSVNSNRTGWGFSIGLGYTYSQLSEGEITNRRETKVDNFSLRMGLDRKYTLGKRWVTGWGLDLVYDANKNSAKNTTGSENSNRSIVETITKASGPGFGPRFTLSFRVAEKILIGTEASYYYKKQNLKNELKQSITSVFIDPNTGRQIVNTNNSTETTEGDQKSFQLNLPAVVFVILKL